MDDGGRRGLRGRLTNGHDNVILGQPDSRPCSVTVAVAVDP